MEELNYEAVSFEIIANVGEAKGLAMKAIKFAKEGKFNETDELFKEAAAAMAKAGHAHMELVSAEANGVKLEIPLLLMHAEDQLLSTETLILMSKEIVALHKEIKQK